MIHHHTAAAYLLFTLNNQHIHSKCTPAHICLNDIPWRAPAWCWWRVASLSGYKNNTTRNSSSAPAPSVRGAASPRQHQQQLSCCATQPPRRAMCHHHYHCHLPGILMVLIPAFLPFELQYILSFHPSIFLICFPSRIQPLLCKRLAFDLPHGHGEHPL